MKLTKKNNYKDGNKIISGNRPLTDFTIDSLASRRLDYLNKTVQLLNLDLTGLISAWNDSDENYRSTFLEETSYLKNILIGMETLSSFELGGERMRVALIAHDQEDEHSCFSDNTHRDIVTNNQGIYNTSYGTYDDFQRVGLRG